MICGGWGQWSLLVLLGKHPKAQVVNDTGSIYIAMRIPRRVMMGGNNKISALCTC